MGRPYLVGLTGGIASGKSAVCARLAEHGVPIIDADVVAREVVAPGEPALGEIAHAFGPEALNTDGTLNRAALRERVFNDPQQRTHLEAILHPRIRQRMKSQALAARAPYVVLAIPLLAESRGDYGWIDCVVVVDTPPTLQLARVMQRDGIDAVLAQRMIDAQASREQRLALANLVLVNDDTPLVLQRRTDQLHADLLARARAMRD